MANPTKSNQPIATERVKVKKKKARRKHKKKASAGASKLRSLIDGAEKAATGGDVPMSDVPPRQLPPVDSMDLDEVPAEASGTRPKPKHQRNKKSPKDKRKEYVDHPNVVFVGNVPLTFDRAQLIKRMGIDPRIVKSVMVRLIRTNIVQVHFRSLPVDSKFASNKRIGVIKGKLTDAKQSQNAYITLVDEKHVDELVAKNTMEVDGHYLFVNRASPASFSVGLAGGTDTAVQKFNRKKTVFVGRLPPATTENELFDVFSNVSQVKGVRIIRDPNTHESKGFGFVAFDTRAAVPEAIEAFNNKPFKGYTLHVMKALDGDAALEHTAKVSKRGPKDGNKKPAIHKKTIKTAPKRKPVPAGQRLQRKKKR